MPLLIIKLLGFTKWLKGAALRYPREAIIVTLLVACAWLYHGNTKRDRVIAKWEAAAKAWDANAALAVAQSKAWEAKSAETAKEADNAFEQNRPDRRSLIVAHADSVRADKVCSRNAPAPAETPTAPVDDIPGLLPGMVVVPRDEYEGLAENTRRLDWIVNVYVPELEARGVAEKVAWPEPDMGGK